MLRNIHSLLRSFSTGLLILAATFIFTVSGAGSKVQAQNARSAEEVSQKGDPMFRVYKGVTIGMTASEVRQKMGEPKDSSGGQDFYSISEKEVVQIFYDTSQKVTAISINYLGEMSGAPDCKAVLGVEIKAEADGSIRKLVRYLKAGYWVSYNHVGGDEPMTTVTMQKIKQ
jgi:hypothetical protein